MPDIEESIKIVKRIIEEKRIAAECALGYPSNSREWKEEAQAIENILNRLEKIEEHKHIALEKINSEIYKQNKLINSSKGNFERLYAFEEMKDFIKRLEKSK